MVKLIVLGLLAGGFFSTTFVLNELMSVSGGHWFWSASLRYLFMWLLLSLMIVLQSRGKFTNLIGLCQLFLQHWRFWCVAGGVGFGGFYAFLCFGADYASGWVIAATFQFTVVASLFVLAFFGQRFSSAVIFYSVMIFIGVVMANIGEGLHAKPNSLPLIDTLLFGALPALLAGFCFPVGNQLVWQASQVHVVSGMSWRERQIAKIPLIKSPLLQNPFHKVWLLTTGSMPLWLVLWVFIRPDLPSGSQVLNTFFVALFAGVIATSLFLYARGHARHSHEVAGVDVTQASEIIFALVGGMWLLNTPAPSLLSWLGIGLIVVGLVLFARQTA